MGELQDIKVLLRDDLYESKDWRYSDTLGRVEWLIGMVASKNEEIEMWLEQIEQLREEIEYLKAQAIHDQYKAESEGEERGYRMGYADGLADGAETE